MRELRVEKVHQRVPSQLSPLAEKPQTRSSSYHKISFHSEREQFSETVKGRVSISSLSTEEPTWINISGKYLK